MSQEGWRVLKVAMMLALTGLLIWAKLALRSASTEAAYLFVGVALVWSVLFSLAVIAPVLGDRIADGLTQFPRQHSAALAREPPTDVAGTR